MLRYKIMYLIIFLESVILYIWTGDNLCIYISYFLVLLYLILYLCEYFGSKYIDINVSMQTECQVSKNVKIKIEMKRNKFIPIGRVKVNLICNNMMFHETKKYEVFLEPGKNNVVNFEMPFTSDDCGKHLFSIEEIRCYDFLMLTEKKLKVSKNFNCIVYPRTVEIQANLEKRPVARNSGELYENNRRGNDVSEILDIRDYMEGDSIRKIHWKLTSKMDEIMVREFSQPSNYDTLILFNAAKTWNGEKIDKDIINSVISITAAISDSFLKQGLGHNVGQIRDDEFVNTAMNKHNSFFELLTNMMSMEIQDKSESAIEAFLGLEMYNQFTKVILVTGHLDEQSETKLAEFVDLSVIVPVKTNSSSLDVMRGYSITSISIEDIKQKVHYITI